MSQRDRNSWLLVAAGLLAAALSATILCGCVSAPRGHEVDDVSVGLDLFGLPLATAIKVHHEEVSDAAIEHGARVAGSPAPMLVLGGRGSQEGL